MGSDVAMEGGCFSASVCEDTPRESPEIREGSSLLLLFGLSDAWGKFVLEGRNSIDGF